MVLPVRRSFVAKEQCGRLYGLDVSYDRDAPPLAAFGYRCLQSVARVWRNDRARAMNSEWWYREVFVMVCVCV